MHGGEPKSLKKQEMGSINWQALQSKAHSSPGILNLNGLGLQDRPRAGINHFTFLKAKESLPLRIKYRCWHSGWYPDEKETIGVVVVLFFLGMATLGGFQFSG